MISLKLRETTGRLPTSTFDLIDNGQFVGFVQVRHQSSAGIGVPQDCASHIYYEINVSEQGKGYGKEALRLALIEAQKIGLSSVVVTCDEDNLASKRIIEVNGGVYTKSCIRNDNKKLLRYESHLSMV